MSEVFGQIQKARGATERLFEILREKSDIKNGELEIDNVKTIEFKNFSFKYPSRDELSIEKLNFKIKAGEAIGIIGPSGVGKSTIFESLLRFYDGNSGDILINKKSIKQYDLASYRANFAYVSQDHFIFSNSVKENLLFANLKANKNDIEEASKKVKALNFINKLPQKFNDLFR